MVNSVDNTNVDGDSITSGFDLVITGTNFATGATVKFVGNDGTVYSSPTVTINSGQQITARIPTKFFDATKEPYDVKVTKQVVYLLLKLDQFNVDATPSWTTAAGTIGGGFNGETANITSNSNRPRWKYCIVMETIWFVT